MPKNHYN